MIHIAEIYLQRYDLGLVRPIRIKGHDIHRREGVVISVVDSDGRTGYGEIAPLPFLYRESLDQAIGQAMQLKSVLIGAEIDTADFDLASQIRAVGGSEIYSSVMLGIEIALFDLCMQHSSLSQPLPGGEILISGLVVADSESYCDEVERLVGRGFTSIKVKVGSSDIADDAGRVQTLRQIIGDRATLRLDANRAWDLKDALDFCSRIGPGGIEYIEEPTKDAGSHSEFITNSPIGLALDETLVESGPNDISYLQGVRAFVLKPGLLGGLSRTREIICAARQSGIAPVMSCTFQSSLTIRAYLLFAAAMGLTDIAAGVDTLKWLADDVLVEPLDFAGGKVDIRSLAGSSPQLRRDVLIDIC
jgi:o-succinylbenzoate synthase